MRVLDGEFHHIADDQLKTRHRAAHARLRQIEQLHGGGGRGHCNERRFHCARTREQLDDSGGDDPERAFGADENMTQIVAGVVLLELRKKVHDAAISQHNLEPQHEIARNTVGHGTRAARIGGKISADGAAAFGSQRKRKQAVDCHCGLLRFRQHHAGFAGHCVRSRIDFPNFVEPRQRKDQLAIEGDLAANQPGVAALRHQRGLGLVGQLEDCLHLTDRTGPQQHRRAAMVEATAFDKKRFKGSGIGDRISVADDCCKARQKIGRRRAAQLFVHVGLPSRRRGPPETIVDRLTQTIGRHFHYRDALCPGSVQRA